MRYTRSSLQKNPCKNIYHYVMFNSRGHLKACRVYNAKSLKEAEQSADQIIRRLNSDK